MKASARVTVAPSGLGDEMSASQQARNKALAITLDNERHEFAKREMALCQEIERLRKLCADAGSSMPGPECDCMYEQTCPVCKTWARLKSALDAAGRGEGESK